MTISIEYEADRVLDLPYREIIENTVLAALDYEGCPYEAEVNVILTDNDAIQEINREHRRIDAPRTCCPFPWWIMSRHQILTMWRRLWRITSILKPES